MLGISEAGEIQLLGLLVTLITAGLVPYLIKKNSRQHEAGSKEREEQTKILNTIVSNQAEIKKDVLQVKEDVISIKSTRIEDKNEFLKLYERVLQYEAEIE